MRDHYDEITKAGPEVVTIGTGDERYAKGFVADEQVPFPVLVDDAAVAARAAAVKKVNMATLLFDPRSVRGARRPRARRSLTAGELCPSSRVSS